MAFFSLLRKLYTRTPCYDKVLTGKKPLIRLLFSSIHLGNKITPDFFERAISRARASTCNHEPTRFPRSSDFAINSRPRRFSSSAGAVVSEPKTSDGMTVAAIVDKRWSILDESEGDWKSNAAAIAQSIQLIKKRLQV